MCQTRRVRSGKSVEYSPIEGKVKVVGKHFILIGLSYGTH